MELLNDRSGSVQLPERFEIEVPDGALGDRAPQGRIVEFTRVETTPARIGDGVLVRTTGGKVYFRIYCEDGSSEEGWMAAPVDVVRYATLKPGEHGAEVVAVMTRGPRWS